MNTKKIAVVCGILGVLSSCAKLGTHSRPKDTLPYEVGELEPQIGGGYDSLVQELRNTPSCVRGEQAKLSTGRSSIDMTQNVDSERILREFSGEVRGTPRFIFKEAGAALGYYRSLNRSGAGLNLVYAVRVDQGGESLRGVVLKEDLASLAPTDLLERCGDHYVAQVNRGGMLTITVSFQFQNEELRSKWESQLKLSGSWAELSKTLKNKVENAGINSTMSVRVVQLGGQPSQALTAGKSCSLSSLDEFQLCKQKVDDLISYAASSFPQQVESQPAILNFITLPLKSLGVKQLPAVPEDVLAVRKKLEGLQSEAIEWTENLEKGRTVGLELEEGLAAMISDNRRGIKEAAQACFRYQIRGAELDWSECLSAGKNLSGQIRPIDKSRLKIHEMSLPSKSAEYLWIINSSAQAMNVAYVLGKHSQLVGGQGKLIPLDSRGSWTLPPGEALRIGRAQGSGGTAQEPQENTLFWRCTDCSDARPLLPTYRLRVPANAEAGVKFFPQPQLSGRYKITAYGDWKSGRFQASSGAEGLTSPCGNRCAVAEAGIQALLGQREGDTRGYPVGTDRILSLREGQALQFWMNDQAGSYGDNSGNIDLILQCVKPGEVRVPSFPIDVEREWE